MQATSLAAGYPDPVLDAQSAFRSVMDALSCPGVPVALITGLAPPMPLTPAAAAIALALLDFEVSFHLAPSLAATGEVARFLRFHTGARETGDPRQASFAFLDVAQDPLDLAAFAPGTADYPDRSTTLIALVSGFDASMRLTLSGPGIREKAGVAPNPLPHDFPEQWAANRAGFPLGVDLVFAAPHTIVGLPRSTRLDRDIS